MKMKFETVCSLLIDYQKRLYVYLSVFYRQNENVDSVRCQKCLEKGHWTYE